MPERPGGQRAPTLACVKAGEVVAIRRILFEGLRELCADLDLHPEDVVRCRAAAPSQLVLEAEGGRRVLLERDWARFIEVSEPPGK